MFACVASCKPPIHYDALLDILINHLQQSETNCQPTRTSQIALCEPLTQGTS